MDKLKETAQRISNMLDIADISYPTHHLDEAVTLSKDLEALRKAEYLIKKYNT